MILFGHLKISFAIRMRSMNERIKSLLVYSAKCIVGALIVLIVSPMIPQVNDSDTIWCLLSILLILSPDGKDSMNLAINRIKANLLGAGVGLVFIYSFPREYHLWLITVALFFTLMFGYYLKLDNCLRSALVATVIVMMPHEEMASWSTPIERILSVIAGCVLAMIITFVFHSKDKEILKVN